MGMVIVNICLHISIRHIFNTTFIHYITIRKDRGFLVSVEAIHTILWPFVWVWGACVPISLCPFASPSLVVIGFPLLSVCLCVCVESRVYCLPNSPIAPGLFRELRTWPRCSRPSSRVVVGAYCTALPCPCLFTWVFNTSLLSFGFKLHTFVHVNNK